MEEFPCQRGNQGAFFADKEKVEEFKHEKWRIVKKNDE